MSRFWRWLGGHRGVGTGHLEAKEAYARALEDRQRAERTAAEVEPVMEKLRHRREVNGFTELFEKAIRGEVERGQ